MRLRTSRRSIFLAVHPDVAVLADRDLQIARLAILRGGGAGLEHRNAGFLDERRGDDEEDQQIDTEVEHRREVDAVVFATRCVTP